ncbi:MAG: phosphate starvation-inducible protein PhoH, partial [Paracoccaceae bacterium]|nr:phosphate starvation-inducible protein PhoH [Paracoccaceae bacterium]
MSVTTLDPQSASAQAGESLLEFPDNRLLIELCGEFDKNLAELERQFTVQIIRRGNQLAVFGEEAPRTETVDVLTNLYERLEAGKHVEMADIDREIRMGGDEATGSETDQLEM